MSRTPGSGWELALYYIKYVLNAEKRNVSMTIYMEQNGMTPLGVLVVNREVILIH